ncbi:hypothetical protein ACFQMJ_16780 [Cohnella cellulosilytica]|uniref:Uncharacterized protein n=2 Tax=Cohnella cellulosilytica TaxID=986710 RepID=A0ABW2FE55_9BACL
MKKFGNVLIVLFSICLVFIGMKAPAYAADTKTEAKTLEAVSLGKIKLKENVIAHIKNLMVLPSGNAQIIGVTLSIENNSNSQINFLDYWLTITTKKGTKLNVQTINKDAVKIPAKTTVNIDFYSNAGNEVKASDLIIRVIEWDFSVSSYTKVLGQVTVPERYSPATPTNNGRVLTSNEVSATFRVSQVVMGQSESFYRPEIKLIIKNDGKRAINLPDYQLFIMNKDNLMYPVTVSGIKDTVLNPVTEKEFSLNASIPIAVKNEGWQLVVMYPIEEGKVSFPLGVFDLPKTSIDMAEELGKYYTFNNSQGTYYVKLDSLNRLPIEDEDLIIANVTVANKGSSTLPLPTFSGKFTFNESIKQNASVANNNKIISIKGNSVVNMQLVSKVPYTFDISKLQLTLQQKETNGSDEGQVIDLVEFTNKGVFDEVPSVLWSVGYKNPDVGYRSEVKVLNKMLYSGATANILAVQLTVENQEKRLSEIQKLAGYFEKPDGTVYPAEFKNITEKLSPGGTAIVTAWSSIPKSEEIEDIKLIVGKAVTEKSSSTINQNDTPNDVLVGYTSPYKFNLPIEFATQPGLRDIKLLPFTFSIEKVDTKLDYQNGIVTLKFDYELLQDLLYKTDLKNDKFVVEIKDPSYENGFTKELSLPIGNDNTGNDGTVLTVGEHSLEFTWTDEKFASIIQKLREYDLNIYHQIQPGYKKLIATQKIHWFVETAIAEE